MTAHRITDRTATVTTPKPKSQAGWLALSAALTTEAPTIADRADLMVTAAPGAGHGAPACFLIPHAHIEINATHFGKIDPATAAPHRNDDRARYAW